MKHSILFLFTFVAFFVLSFNSIAQEQKIILTTSNSIGTALSLGVNCGISISVDWGNGDVKSYRTSNDFITNELKGTTVTITGENMTWFSCDNSALETLDVTQAPLLQVLCCQGNHLRVLDLSKNKKLKQLRCSDNQLEELELSSNRTLTDLNCSTNKLTTLTIARLTALKTLICSNNELADLSTSTNSALETLWCQNNKLTTLSLTKNKKLKSLVCSYNQLTSIDAQGVTTLIDIWCDNNQLPFLDIMANTSLESLSCDHNQLDSISLPIVSSSILKAIYLNDNALRISSLYSPVKYASGRYDYSPQALFKLPKDILVGMELNLSDETRSADGLPIQSSFSWKNSAGETLAKGKDYKVVRTGVFEFLVPQTGIHCEIIPSKTRFGEYTAISETIDILPTDVLVNELTNINWYVEEGTLYLEISEPTAVTIVNGLGQMIQSGYYEAGTYSFLLKKGFYLINGIKVIL